MFSLYIWLLYSLDHNVYILLIILTIKQKAYDGDYRRKLSTLDITKGFGMLHFTYNNRATLRGN